MVYRLYGIAYAIRNNKFWGVYFEMNLQILNQCSSDKFKAIGVFNFDSRLDKFLDDERCGIVIKCLNCGNELSIEIPVDKKVPFSCRSCHKRGYMKVKKSSNGIYTGTFLKKSDTEDE